MLAAALLPIPRLYFSLFHRLWTNIKTKFNGSVPTSFFLPPPFKNGCRTKSAPSL